MAEDPLRSVIDDIRARLHAELEAHLGGLAQTHEQAVVDARRHAEADAERRWAAKLEEVSGQWTARLQSEVSATRADVERTMIAEALRVRQEAEQSAAELANQARRELDEAVAAERTRAQADLERAQAERERAQADLERAHAEVERTQADRERAQADRERLQAELERAHGDVARIQAELQRVQADAITAQADLACAKQDLARAHDELQRTQAALQRSHEDVQRAQAERQHALDELQSARAALQRREEELQGAQEGRQHADDERQGIQAALQRREEEVQRVGEDRQRVQDELEATRADLQRTREELQRGQWELGSAQSQVDEVRTRADREIADARAAFDADRAMAAAAAVQLAAPRSGPSPGLLDALRAIDEASSLSATLAAVVKGAALESPRAALFIVNGTALQEWPVDGVPSVHAGRISCEGQEAGFLADVLRRGEPQAIDGTNGSAAPAFAGIAAGRRAVAVPFVLGGQPVALLYADEGTDGQPLPSWRDTVQILGRHASACLGYLTAVRTAQALKSIRGGSDAGGSGAADDDALGARRYARLLVSEIKMYNDGAVRTGRERRDLLQRLKPEIERARRLYEERVAPSHARDLYFQQELLQTLAEGDQSLLG
jgi:hypothetical protein